MRFQEDVPFTTLSDVVSLELEDKSMIFESDFESGSAGGSERREPGVPANKCRMYLDMGATIRPRIFYDEVSQP